MLGYPDGTLTWNNTDLAATAITNKSIVENGYIRYANGLMIQWNAKNFVQSFTIVNRMKYVLLPIAFTSELWIACSYAGSINFNQVGIISSHVNDANGDTCSTHNPYNNLQSVSFRQSYFNINGTSISYINDDNSMLGLGSSTFAIGK